jgi:histidyl-tRNA synthetase
LRLAVRRFRSTTAHHVTDEKRIEPRTLKGFRDYLPEAMIPREWLIDAARRVYRSYGFAPIDTPALEYLEILTGKGGEETDKQLYRFQDHGGRAVGMRFDLTVPLARFVAQHAAQLGTPFKRYHIAAVWRGENTQRGRFREFMQCDFDTIGTLALAADIETALVIHDLFEAIGAGEFVIRVNNRLVLTGLLERLGLADRATAVLRSLDKLDKIGREKVAAELTAAGIASAQADEVLALGRRRRRRGAANSRDALDRPGARLLHRHGVRDVSRQVAWHRQRLLGRKVRQPGGAVHEGKVARHRRVAGAGPAAGGA